jgi:hypothetical protein
VSAHVVGLAKGGSWECRLTGKALRAVAVCCAVIVVAVGTWVELGRGGGIAGWCGRTDVLGVGWLLKCAVAAVIMVCIVQGPGGAVLKWRWQFEAGGGASPIAGRSFTLAHLYVGVSRGSSGVVGDVAFNVHAQVVPGLVGMVVLSVLLGEVRVWCEG